MEEKKLGIFFVSKNNYQLYDVWMNESDTENYTILNIDEDSTPENKKIGREVCKKYGIHYMDREIKGLQNNIKSACNFFKEKGIEWFIWFQHDCYPLTKNFFSKFDNLIKTGKINDFGVVGFKVKHEKYQMFSRSPLQYPREEMWVRSSIDNPINENYLKPHLIESAAWMCASLNINQFEKHIIPTTDYQFFHSWDDIAFQFLYNNIPNLCIPYFEFSHEQTIKKQYKIPVKSPLARNKEEEKQREHYYGHFNHHKIWEKRWGFNYDKGETFENVKDHYKSTLIYDLYNHNIHLGPLQTFEL